MSKHPRCPDSGKLMYPDWDKAVHAAFVSSRKRKVALRAYECAACDCWHLTKRPGNPVVATVPGPFTPADLARVIARKGKTA